MWIIGHVHGLDCVAIHRQYRRVDCLQSRAQEASCQHLYIQQHKSVPWLFQSMLRWEGIVLDAHEGPPVCMAQRDVN